MSPTTVDAPRLRALRVSHGMTLRDVQDKTGVHFSYLSRLERGQAPVPRYSVVAKLADLYGVSTEELMHETKER
jgi:transcriptional regulator with XRE-family HTH domain